MAFIGKQPGKAAITSTDITDGIITAAKLASDSVTTAKIADNGVTTAKINADAVTDAKIADDVVGTEHLTAGEVDTTALGADAVTAAKIADDAISDEHLDPTAITGQTAETSAADDDLILLSDTSASAALKKMTRSNFLSGVGGTNTPSFLARASTNQTFNDSTTTQVVFGTESYDTANGFASNTYTIPSGQGGKYNLYFNINGYDSGSSLKRLVGSIYLNDTKVVEFTNDTVDNYMQRINTGGSIVLDLSVGDTLKIYALLDTNDSSTSATVGSSSESKTYFGGYKLIE